MSLLLALALAAAQQDQTAFRTEKGDYVPAIQRCREGEALIDSDPFGAIELFDSIINNPKIKKIECRIRVEERSSEYTAWYLFLPYQYRGRARLGRSEKASGGAAQRLLEAAVADFERSVKAGVPSSAAYLKTAKERLAKLRASTPTPPPSTVDALAAFRPRWQEFLLGRKYRSALGYLATSGKTLTEAQRAALKTEAETECRRLVSRALVDFRRNLAAIRTERDLTIMTDRDFQTAFALPPASELIVSDPGLDWARAHVADLKAVQAKKATGATLLAAAVAAAPLVPGGENPWFRPLADVAFDSIRADVAAKVEAARDAAKADRDRLRAAAVRLQSDWTGAVADLAAKVDKSFPNRHGMDGAARELRELIASFPTDLAELEKIDVAACFSSATPTDELARIGRLLRALTGREGVSRESRRSLHTRIVAVAAMRGLLEGKSEAQVAGGLAAEAAALKAAGGPDDASAYGPRVAKVFELLPR